MECISELKDSLNVYFGWNKARMACFLNMLHALLATRTVNLNKLACVVFGDALQSSRYRRIQRFFSKFPLNYPKQPLQHMDFAEKSNAISVVLRGVDLTLRTRISRIKLELKNWLHCWPLHLHGLIVLVNGRMRKSQ